MTDQHEIAKRIIGGASIRPKVSSISEAFLLRPTVTRLSRVTSEADAMTFLSPEQLEAISARHGHIKEMERRKINVKEYLTDESDAPLVGDCREREARATELDRRGDRRAFAEERQMTMSNARSTSGCHALRARVTCRLPSGGHSATIPIRPHGWEPFL